jgi:uncharacterized protein DUF5946
VFTSGKNMESEMSEPTERCIGCGAIVTKIDGPIHRYMASAPGCWAKHGQVSAHLLSDSQAAPYRQLCADAYAVQHPGHSAKGLLHVVDAAVV